MLGTCGEVIIENTNTTDDIIETIKAYENNFNTPLPSPFIIKKIGIKPSADCIVKINGRDFKIKYGEVLEFGYNIFDIKSIIAQTNNVELTIRYLY